MQLKFFKFIIISVTLCFTFTNGNKILLVSSNKSDKSLSIPAKIHVFLLKLLGHYELFEDCIKCHSNSYEEDPYFRQLSKTGNSTAYSGPFKTEISQRIE
ncbi:hypothetical protein PVAND_010709 [Polypedilum vanderplanki]|uniref:Uncharacterized protein n=1 Tax=Polypedilum vanderplanki TaxID=319348 RepID=A0A9J6CGE6_POLVA|nr:hypothetical protein PVAND_010709 [Polypedilum vanderplanki]